MPGDGRATLLGTGRGGSYCELVPYVAEYGCYYPGNEPGPGSAVRRWRERRRERRTRQLEEKMTARESMRDIPARIIGSHGWPAA
jgi:hypothetical protein